MNEYHFPTGLTGPHGELRCGESPTDDDDGPRRPLQPKVEVRSVVHCAVVLQPDGDDRLARVVCHNDMTGAKSVTPGQQHRPGCLNGDGRIGPHPPGQMEFVDQLATEVTEQLSAGKAIVAMEFIQTIRPGGEVNERMGAGMRVVHAG